MFGTLITVVKSESEHVDNNGEDDALSDPVSRHMHDMDCAMFRDAGEIEGKHSLTCGDERPYVCYICTKSFVKCSDLTSHIQTHIQERLHSCSLCHKQFVKLSNMKTHMLTHTGEKPHECDVCQKRFTCSSSLARHLPIHTGEKQHACDLYHKRFIKRSDLKRHILTHTGEKSHKCAVCHRRFSDSSTRNTHLLTHTSIKRYGCDICHRMFTRRSTVNKHMLIHTGEKPHECDICHKSFTRRSTLNNHMLAHADIKGEDDVLSDRLINAGSRMFRDAEELEQTVRDNVTRILTRVHNKPYASGVCDEQFAVNADVNEGEHVDEGDDNVLCDRLSSHSDVVSGLLRDADDVEGTLTEHSQADDGGLHYTCYICSEAFVNSDCLAGHILTHMDNKAYIDNMCDKQFAVSSHLVSDEVSRTAAKPYACSVCQKQFTESSSLARHRFIHTGEKRHACKMCDKRFIKRSDLTRHIRTHTGEKPHECGLCRKSFTRRDDLNKHVLGHTDDKGEDDVLRDTVSQCLIEVDACSGMIRDAGEVERPAAKPYTCNICHKQFTDNSILTRHLLIHSGEKRHACDMCHMRFIQRSDLKRHIRTHAGEKLHECDVCYKRFGERDQLNNHMLEHTGNKGMDVVSCDSLSGRLDEVDAGSGMLRNAEELEQTVRDNVTRILTRVHNKPYTSDVCDEQFAVNADVNEGEHVNAKGDDNASYDPLSSHDNVGSGLLRDAGEVEGTVVEHSQTHDGETCYTCYICSEAFDNSDSLATHIHTHIDNNLYTDDVCNEKFAVSNEVTHTPYTCSVCQKQFANSSSLARHVLRHSSEKPHACDLCDMRFIKCSDLKKHIRTHTGKKLHECDLCQKRFSQRDHLNKHMFIHSGERPHKCDICQKSFTRRSTLNKHTLAHIDDKREYSGSCDMLLKRLKEVGDADEVEQTVRNNVIRILTHVRNKPYKVDGCGKQFDVNTDVTESEHDDKVDDGVLSDPLSNCDNDVVSGLLRDAEEVEGTLTEHSQTYGGELCYTCYICSEAFVNSESLASHILTHMDNKPYIDDACDKPFTCNVCHKQFTKGCHLKSHILTPVSYTHLTLPTKRIV